MDRVLEGMNFGPVIRQIIKCLYTNIESAILSNGNLSYFFNVYRGARQGCPCIIATFFRPYFRRFGLTTRHHVMKSKV